MFESARNIFYVIVAFITILSATTGIASVYSEWRVRTVKNEINIEKLTDELTDNSKLLTALSKDIEWIKSKLK